MHLKFPCTQRMHNYPTLNRVHIIDVFLPMMETVHFSHVHNFVYFLVNTIFTTNLIELPIIEAAFSELAKILINPQIFFLLGFVLLEPDMMP